VKALWRSDVYAAATASEHSRAPIQLQGIFAAQKKRKNVLTGIRKSRRSAREKGHTSAARRFPDAVLFARAAAAHTAQLRRRKVFSFYA